MKGKKQQHKPVAATPATESANTPSDKHFFFGSLIGPALVLLVAAAVPYLPILSHGFLQYDDGETIFYNETVMNPSFGALLKSKIVGMYVPVSAIIYAITYQLGGGKAEAFHLMSIALHAIASILTYVLVRKLQPHAIVAFLTALLFAVHPVKVEPVSWVAAQTTIVFSLFYLASLIAWVNFRQAKGAWWQWASLGFFLLAGLSKSAAVTLPLLLPVLDWYLGVHKEKFNPRNYLYLLPFLAIAVALGLYTFVTREQSGAAIAVANTQYNLFDRILMAAHTLLFYPYKMLLPLALTINYPMSKENGAWPWHYFAALPVLLGILYYLYTLLRKGEKMAALSLLLYLLPLSIMLPLVSVGTAELRSDRYLYIPSIGFFMGLTYLTHRFFPRWHAYAWAVVAIAFAYLTFEQSKTWKDDASVFRNCVERYPNSAICNCNLAYGELLKRDFNNSIEHYTRSLELDENCVECYNGRGQAYLFTDKIEPALADFTKAIEGGVVTPKLFLNRGICLVKLNRPAEAVPDLSRSLELEPKAPDAWYFRAAAQEKLGKKAEAVSDYSKSIELNPNYLEALVNRGVLQYSLGNYQAAIQDYERAAQIAAPGVKPMILTNLANTWMQLGDRQKALQNVEAALAINPNYTRAQQTKAALQ
ncbi:MAG: tetratricopeptide repeat protein [Chitinophagales bacterium]|nr:tetratricopeptide repeat protein [Chitinophagales bacterium]